MALVSSKLDFAVADDSKRRLRHCKHETVFQWIARFCSDAESVRWRDFCRSKLSHAADIGLIDFIDRLVYKRQSGAKITPAGMDADRTTKQSVARLSSDRIMSCSLIDRHRNGNVSVRRGHRIICCRIEACGQSKISRKGRNKRLDLCNILMNCPSIKLFISHCSITTSKSSIFTMLSPPRSYIRRRYHKTIRRHWRLRTENPSNPPCYRCPDRPTNECRRLLWAQLTMTSVVHRRYTIIIPRPRTPLCL